MIENKEQLYERAYKLKKLMEYLHGAISHYEREIFAYKLFFHGMKMMHPVNDFDAALELAQHNPQTDAVVSKRDEEFARAISLIDKMVEAREADRKSVV